MRNQKNEVCPAHSGPVSRLPGQWAASVSWLAQPACAHTPQSVDQPGRTILQVLGKRAWSALIWRTTLKP